MATGQGAKHVGSSSMDHLEKRVRTILLRLTKNWFECQHSVESSCEFFFMKLCCSEMFKNGLNRI